MRSSFVRGRASRRGNGGGNSSEPEIARKRIFALQHEQREKEAREEFFVKYWLTFCKQLYRRRSKLRVRESLTTDSCAFNIGMKGETATAHIILKPKIGIELTIASTDPKSFDGLITRQWHRMRGDPHCRMSTFHPVNLYNEGEWWIQFEWLQAAIEKFDEALRRDISKSPVILLDPPCY
jgi:hypothetical protein